MPEMDMDKLLQEEITADNCGEKIDLICRAAGITLTELAGVLNEKPSTLSHIKKRAENPNQGRLPSTKFMSKLQALAMIRPKGEKQATDSRITVGKVAAGLSALARTKLLGSAAIASIGYSFMGQRLGIGFLSFGVLHAVDAICRSLGLSYREAKDALEILRSTEDEQNPD